MTIWPELRLELLRLREEEPDPLQSYPNPETLDRPPPYSITVQPTALAVAEALHQRFGSDVELRVGALPYPPADDTSVVAPHIDEGALPGLPEGLTVALTPPLTVRSGETKRHRLLISNGTAADLTLNTTGQLLAMVRDPATGAHVGGLTGAMHTPLVAFKIAVGRTVPVPLLVGTASYLRDLGFTIPPGHWGLTVDLRIADRGLVRTPILDFEITA